MALTFAIVLVAAVVATPSVQAKDFKVLYTFTGPPDGANPFAGLVQDAAGNLYGTTQDGGASNVGTVFKVDKTGKETVLYSFTGNGVNGDGSYPEAGLVRDAAGNLYGTTDTGGGDGCSGGYGCGTVFKLDKTGKETVLHAFTGGRDGAYPEAGLVRDAAGNLYGTTFSGGDLSSCYDYGCGVVFKLDKTGKETVLYTFTGGTDGGQPQAGLVRDAADILYGTTVYGGAVRECEHYGCGTVFKLDETGKETMVHIFAGGQDGHFPEGGLVRDAAGNLYGTTNGGGGHGCSNGGGCGAVFKVDKTGKETVLHSFAGRDGKYPSAGLVRDAAGNLYGTTSEGGAHGYGTAFMLDKTGRETVLHSFSDSDGRNPYDGLIRDAKGNLYGTTSCCDPSRGDGTVFELTP
jgi:uncharacterized repeat protein (TIGR03803 family)